MVLGWNINATYRRWSGFTVTEASVARPGNAAILARLTELMFVEILREYMQRLPADRGGWLAGLNDPHVGKALRLMHANPARDWTVDDLGHEVAVSRSVRAAGRRSRR